MIAWRGKSAVTTPQLSQVHNDIILTLCMETACKMVMFVPAWLLETVQPSATIEAKSC